MLDSRQKGRGFEPHRRHCVVVLEQDTYILAYYWFNPGEDPSRITERLLSGCKESNQTNKNIVGNPMSWLNYYVDKILFGKSTYKVFSTEKIFTGSYFFFRKSMGRIFLSHIGGTRLFSCASCDTPLTNRAELVSTRFTGTVKPVLSGHSK